MKKAILFLFTVLSINAFAQAFESFNFTGLASANGWTVHSGTSGAISAITTPSGSGNSLSYPGLEASTGNRILMSGSNAEDINKSISLAGTSFYFSFLINVTDLTNMNATGSYFIHLGANTTGTTPQFSIFIPRVYIALGTAPGTFKLGIMNTTGASNTTYIAQDLNPNTTYLVVAKVESASIGSSISSSLWLNPVPGAAEPIANAVNTSGTSTWPTNPILSLCLRQSTGIGTFELDEIRVGTTWASVTPSSASSCVTYNTISAMACNSYSLNNQTYTTSGTYVQTLTNANAAGCDSIINLNLIIHNSTTSTQNVTFCGPYTLNGQTYTSSGTYTQNLQNVHGCDSTLTLNLNLVGSLTYYQDSDNDGYGNAAVSQSGCTPIAGYVTNSSDCNDNNNQIHPGAVDVPGNGIDEDCNGFDAPLQMGVYEFAATVDCATQDVAATNAGTNFTFSNFEAQGTACASGGGVFNRSGWNTTAILDLNQYNQFTISGVNCTNLNLNKLALNQRTSTTGGTPTIFVRSSLDNYATDIDTLASGWNGNIMFADTINLPAAFSNVSSVTFRFYVINQATSTSTLRMDNVSVWGNTMTITPTLFYADQDGDGFGNLNMDTLLCNAPAGYVSNSADCNDNDALVNPNTVWYQDLDNDQVGNTAISQVSCTQPAGFVLIDGDCNDNDASITAPTMYYSDNDQDGFGDDATGALFCQAPVNLIPIGGDCDDNNNAINPNAAEICDGLDNNCDGQEDEGLTFLNYYFDGDSDGFGIGNPTVSCSPIAGYATQTGDCDDSNNSVYPGATDTEGNGIDENCDGIDGVVSVTELQFESTIAPNPSSGIFEVQLNTAVSLEVLVLDLNGKVQATFTSNSKTIQLDLTQLNPGTYFLNLVSDSQQTTHRLVKL